MTGREDKFANDLFFLCSLIEYVARQTRNRRGVIVNAIGRDRLAHILNLADVYHSDNIDMYYENPSYIYESWIQESPVEDD